VVVGDTPQSSTRDDGPREGMTWILARGGGWLGAEGQASWSRTPVPFYCVVLFMNGNVGGSRARVPFCLFRGQHRKDILSLFKV
jgi:hypothetical protein